MRAAPLLIALIAALSVGYASLAQSNTPDHKTTGRVVEGSPADGPESISLDIDFAGGTVAKFLEDLKSVSAYQNIIIKPGGEQYEMPPVTLRSAPLIDVFEAVHTITDGRVGYERSGPVIVCWTMGSRSPNNGSPEPMSTAVWSIERFQPAVRAEDVLSSVEAALAVVGGEPVIRFHEETSLIILRGTSGHIDAVESILRGIEQTQNARERKSRITAEVELTGLDIARQSSQLTLALREHEVATKRLEETRKLMEQGLVSENELLDQELNVHRFAAQVEQARADLHKAEIRYQSMQDQLGNPGN